jgi:hypothetical protein
MHLVNMVRNRDLMYFMINVTDESRMSMELF